MLQRAETGAAASTAPPGLWDQALSAYEMTAAAVHEHAAAQQRARGAKALQAFERRFARCLGWHADLIYTAGGQPAARYLAELGATVRVGPKGQLAGRYGGGIFTLPTDPALPGMHIGAPCPRCHLWVHRDADSLAEFGTAVAAHLTDCGRAGA